MGIKDGTEKLDMMSIFGMEIRSVGADEEKRREAVAERQAQEAKQIALETHYTSLESGVPQRYWKESIRTYQCHDEQERKNIERIRFYCSEKSNKVLVLCGNNGTGKSMLGCAIIRERGGTYKPMLKLVYEVESSMSYKASKSKIDLLDGLCSQKMLVLDEVGRGVRQEQQQELLYYILNERYGSMLPTVLISNLPKMELVRFLGSATKDRLNETCEFLEFTGKSYRETKREEACVDF